MSGLENQVRFKIADYRDLNEKFDRIVSVGMFEHVGESFTKLTLIQFPNY